MKNGNRLLVGTATATLLLLLPANGHTQVTSADDVCAPTDDPCVISSSVVAQNQAVLDFGSRELRITGGGTLDTLTGSVVVRCGKFVADTGTNVALKVRGPDGTGSISGGVLTLEASRGCSEDTSSRCFEDPGCNFGTCSAHVCSADALVKCSTDTDCARSCGTNKRCAGQSGRSCVVDADCNFGTCLTDALVCATKVTRACSIDSDCDDGVCNVGDGSISLNGRVRAEGQGPGAVFLTAAGDITTFQNFTLGGTSAFDDGGLLEIDSRSGSVTLNNNFDGTGGGDSQGGDFSFLAAQDVTVNGLVNVNGGDFDGGFVEIDAGRDININADVTANATSGEGFGGDIAAFASGDVNVTGVVNVQANGHRSADNSCGEAGPIELDAGGDITIGPDVTLEADGPIPDCDGGDVTLSAGGNVSVAGKIRARGQGTGSGGGLIDVAALGTADFAATSSIDVSGGSGGTGSIDIAGGGDVTLSGSASGAASNGGTADSIVVDSGDHLFLSGSLGLSGGTAINGIIDLTACRLTVQGGGIIDNAGANSHNFLTGRETLNVQAGALIEADAATGTNTLTYRDAAKPPVVAGTITPAAVTVLNAELQGCPVCGNGEIEQSESCDDGNTTGGDGCSADCQDEGCIAQTPDYPNVPLCDDGQGCTVDACNGETSTCTHVFDCDDAVDCTEDSCGQDGNCQHVVNHGSCSDGDPCTTDTCNSTTGCSSTTNSNPCDDGLACTIGDVCADGVCAGTVNCPADQICSINSGQCVDEGGVCGNGLVEPPAEQCDDGDVQWAPGQYCDAGCSQLLCGDPDDNGTTNASDALYILRVAVSLSACDPCVCNVDSLGTPPVSASDALRVLRRAVNIPGELICPACA